MVRAEKAYLEIHRSQTQATISGASPELTEYILELKAEQDEIRAQGGIPIEQLIEEQRNALDSENLTPVTAERFKAWKLEKKRKEEREWEEKRKAAAKKGGKGLNVLSGRALFTYDASLFVDDDGAMDDAEYDVVEEEEEDRQATTQKKEGAMGSVTVKLQESLYLDDDAGDLDDLD